MCLKIISFIKCIFFPEMSAGFTPSPLIWLGSCSPDLIILSILYESWFILLLLPWEQVLTIPLQYLTTLSLSAMSSRFPKAASDIGLIILFYSHIPLASRDIAVLVCSFCLSWAWPMLTFSSSVRLDIKCRHLNTAFYLSRHVQSDFSVRRQSACISFAMLER